MGGGQSKKHSRNLGPFTGEEKKKMGGGKELDKGLVTKLGRKATFWKGRRGK